MPSLKTVLTAKVVGAQLLWNNAAEAVRILSTFEGQEVSVPLSKLRKTRSYLQNAYYWGVVIELTWAGFWDLGHNIRRDDVHEILKMKFLLRSVIGAGGEIIYQYPGSTATLSTIEFMAYVAEIQQWAVENLGINIPDPNQKLIEDNDKTT